MQQVDNTPESAVSRCREGRVSVARSVGRTVCLFFVSMNPLQLLNMDESMKGTDGAPVESQSNAVFSQMLFVIFK